MKLCLTMYDCENKKVNCVAFLESLLFVLVGRFQLTIDGTGGLTLWWLVTFRLVQSSVKHTVL